MKNRYLNAFFSSCLSIVPIFVIVLLLSFSRLARLDFYRGDYVLLLIGMIILIVGLTFFQIGVSSGLSKVGEYMGTSLSNQKSLFIVILFSFTLGALITCAEPSILIVTKQVSIPPLLLIGGIAVGVGIFVVIGMLRIIQHKPLKLWYIFFYAITFMILVFVAMDPNKRRFLPFIFDSGGITTGSATVPFILALGAGVATVRGGKSASNDSFGLVGMASIGPILTMTILIMIANISGNYNPSDYYSSLTSLNSIPMMFMKALLPQSLTDLGSLLSVFIAFAPIILIFFIYNFLFLRLPKRQIYKILIGFLFSYIGLVLFLCATSATMTPIGFFVGGELGKNVAKPFLVLIAFFLGLVTILCEPAVHVLTNQMENISDGRIKKITVLLSLSIGVGIAIGLATLRVIMNFSIMYIVIPGYALSFILMFVCPDIYSAMAFDSGGTASGPMASSFILPMIVGVTGSIYGEHADYYENSFGVIALIALTPILAIQLLGIFLNIKNIQAKKIMQRYIYSVEDAQIIHF